MPAQIMEKGSGGLGDNDVTTGNRKAQRPADPAEKENPADRTINGIEFWRSGRDSNPRPST